MEAWPSQLLLVEVPSHSFSLALGAFGEMKGFPPKAA
jgi:hypothetical protein